MRAHLEVFSNVLNFFATSITALLLISGSAQAAASIQVVHFFDSTSANPGRGLVPGPQDALYGAVRGAIFQVRFENKKWTVKTIYTPSFTSNAASIVANGSEVFVAYYTGPIIQLTPPASGMTQWTVTQIYTFENKGAKNGSDVSGLTLADANTLFGNTMVGGGSKACGDGTNGPLGCGTVFKLEKQGGKWVETVLHRYQSGTDGTDPVTDPAVDANGDVFVTTNEGGAPKTAESSRDCASGSQATGTIDQEVAKGDTYAYQELYAQRCVKAAMAYLASTPVLVSNSNAQPGKSKSEAATALIATSEDGGKPGECKEEGVNGCGAVALFTQPKDGKTPWKEDILHAFNGAAQHDGAIPIGHMLLADNKTIYGVTDLGGESNKNCRNRNTNAKNGCGTIYKLTLGTNGWAWGGTVFQFQGGKHGSIPLGFLTIYKGMIVGLTQEGGKGCEPYGCGTMYVFKP